MTEDVLIALGSNIGDRAAFLGRARAAISTLPATRMLAASAVEETAPFGSGPQGPYLNQMLRVATSLHPLTLLRALQGIERRMGRVRTRRWSARVIDLDIVRFGSVSLRTRELVLPHPGLRDRSFWQREAAALAALAEAA